MCSPEVYIRLQLLDTTYSRDVHRFPAVGRVPRMPWLAHSKPDSLMDLDRIRKVEMPSADMRENAKR